MKSHSLFKACGLATALIALLFQLIAIQSQSFTADEPYFLFAGYQTVRYGRNTEHLEHPPLVAMLAALSLLSVEAATDNPYELIFRDPVRMRRIQFAGRSILLVTIALPFLGCCFLLGREIAGTRAGIMLALTMSLSFQVLPYLTIVQTDAAAGLGFTATLFMLARFLRQPTLALASGIGLAMGLALAAKFSSILLAPAVLTALLIAKAPHLPWRRRFVFLGVIVVCSITVLHLTYDMANRHYESEKGREAIRRYCRNPGGVTVDDHLREFEEPLLTLERFDPMAAQWLTGVLAVAAQNRVGAGASYAFGHITAYGRWWFYPLLLLIRTPLALWVGSLFACRAAFVRRDAPSWIYDPYHRQLVAVLAVTVGVYFSAALLSTYNLGVRHLLPVLPVFYLPAVAWAARRRRYTAALIGALLVETYLLCPLWMSSTNTWWLGRYNPTQCAVISDCEYNQNFFILAAQAKQRGIESLQVAFPILPEIELKGEMPNAIPVDPHNVVAPGWHAVNVLIERFLPAVRQANREQIKKYDFFIALAETWKPYLDAVRQGEDHGEIGGSFRLYYLPEKAVEEIPKTDTVRSP